MKKFLVIAFASTLLIGFIDGSVAATTAKQGATCAKLNTSATVSGQKLTCTKVAGKLVWNKARVSAVTPNPAPTVAPAASIAGQNCATLMESKVVGALRFTCQGPGRQSNFQWDAGTSTSFKATIPITLPVVAQTGADAITFDNVVAKFASVPTVSYNRIQETIAKNSAVEVPHTIDVGPNTTTFTKTIEEGMLAKEFRLWAGFKQVSFLNVIAYNNADIKWAQEKLAAVYAARKYKADQDPDHGLHLTSQTCSASSQPGQTTGEVGDCYAGAAGSIGNSDDGLEMLGITSKYPSYPWNPYQTGEVTHEYMHTVQGAQFIGTGSAMRSYYVHMQTPCWIHEGQPNAIGLAISAKDLAMYLERSRDVTGNGALDSQFPGFTAEGLKQYLYSQVTNESDAKSCYNNGPLYKMSYSLGMAATEMLVAIGGPQSTLALIALQAEGQSFAEAFNAVYGITWEKGSTILGQALAAKYAATPYQKQ